MYSCCLKGYGDYIIHENIFFLYYGMSKEIQLCVKIIFILVDIWMFLQMRSVEFREKTSGDSHRNTMEGLSQDKNGRRALLNKQIHEVSLLSPLVVHKRHGFIHIMVVNMIFLPQIYDILDFCFLSQ